MIQVITDNLWLPIYSNQTMCANVKRLFTVFYQLINSLNKHPKVSLEPSIKTLGVIISSYLLRPFVK